MVKRKNKNKNKMKGGAEQTLHNELIAIEKDYESVDPAKTPIDPISMQTQAVEMMTAFKDEIDRLKTEDSTVLETQLIEYVCVIILFLHWIHGDTRAFFVLIDGVLHSLNPSHTVQKIPTKETLLTGIETSEVTINKKEQFVDDPVATAYAELEEAQAILAKAKINNESSENIIKLEATVETAQTKVTTLIDSAAESSATPVESAASKAVRAFQDLWTSIIPPSSKSDPSNLGSQLAIPLIKAMKNFSHLPSKTSVLMFIRAILSSDSSSEPSETSTNLTDKYKQLMKITELSEKQPLLLLKLEECLSLSVSKNRELISQTAYYLLELMKNKKTLESVQAKLGGRLRKYTSKKSRKFKKNKSNTRKKQTSKKQTSKKRYTSKRYISKLYKSKKY